LAYDYQSAVADVVVKVMDDNADVSSKPVFCPENTELSALTNAVLPAAKETNVSSENITYEFDSVRIDKAFEFYVTADFADDFVTAVCGKERELRVIIADFTLFGNSGNIGETIVVVAGEDGIYSCLLNSYIAPEWGNDQAFVQRWGFSSHKKLNGTNVEKNFDEWGNVICVTEIMPGVFNFEAGGSENVYQNFWDVKALTLGEPNYGFVEGSYRETGASEIYGLNIISSLSLDAKTESAPVEYKLPVFNEKFEVIGQKDAKIFAVSCDCTDASGAQIDKLYVVITGDTVLSNVTLEELKEGKNIRINFKDCYQQTSFGVVAVATMICGQ